MQGVFFRASAAREARTLGVTGHAVNLPDGRVEVLVCGPAEAVDAMCRWLRRGPPSARVDSVALEPAECPDGPPSEFTTG